MSEFGYHVSQVRGKPDWTVWGNIPQAKLWQCVFLSLDLDPGNPIEDEPIWTHTPAMFDDHERRLSVARAHAGPGGLLRRGPGSPATGSSEVAASGRKRISLKNFVDWSQTLTPPWPLPAEMLHLGSGPVQEPDMNAQAEPDWQIVKRYRHASLSHLLGWACGVDMGKLAELEPVQRDQILKGLPLKQWQQLAVSAFHDPRKVFFAKATGEGEPLERVAEVAEFRAWARSVDFELPPDFPVGDDPVPCEREIEPLNRPDELNDSLEADGVTHASKDVCTDGQKKPEGGPIKQIRQCLDQHDPESPCPEVSQAATDTPAMSDDHERPLSVAQPHAGPGGLLRRGPGSPTTGLSELAVAVSGQQKISFGTFVDSSQTQTNPWTFQPGSGPLQGSEMNARVEPDWQIVKRYRHASLGHLLGWACGVDIGKLADIEPLQRHQILKELPLKQWQQLAVSAFHDPRKVFFAKATGEGEPLERVVEVAEFRAWARSVDFELPPDFPVGDDPVPCERGIEQLNRPGGLNYSPELDVAFHAWKNLYADGQKKPRGGPRKQIMQWLDQHCPKSQYPALSRAARERIATMINPWKEGGVTATL